MARIVCLANSYKDDPGRCIAGIELETSKWIRPVSPRGAGAIYKERLIGGEEPQLLDILDIPLGAVAPDLGCQPENRYFGTGTWKKVGTMSRKEAVAYAEICESLLHGPGKRVDPAYIAGIPKNLWKSLQLVHVSRVRLYVNRYGKPGAEFQYGDFTYDLKVTDPAASDRIKAQGDYLADCLLTVSMAGAYKAPCDDKPYCYKMIAAVIELGQQSGLR